ncbi:hypothetical protein QZH41_020673 [Actinostola sp. cb2023]|nr:hypothetical protein QZH41_020673 [Actinostola sp. cb2023]
MSSNYETTDKTMTFDLTTNSSAETITSDVKKTKILRLDEQHFEDEGGCGPSRLANIRHGNIFSPRWPLPYPDFVDCVWAVRARKDLQIKLIFFDFDVNVHEPCEQNLDFLEVRAGSNGYTHARTLQTKNTECGKKDPFDMIIKSDTFYITFRSDRSTGPRGFMAGFVAFETEAAEFQPHILIVFGAALLILIIVTLKKFIIPLLSAIMRKRKSKNGFRKCGLPKRSCKFGYSCGYQESKIMPPKQIDDCPQLESSDAPGVPKESFLDDLPSVESTFLPLPTPIPTVFQKCFRA